MALTLRVTSATLPRWTVLQRTPGRSKTRQELFPTKRDTVETKQTDKTYAPLFQAKWERYLEKRPTLVRAIKWAKGLEVSPLKPAHQIQSCDCQS
jgi:hypothetical protein